MKSIWATQSGVVTVLVAAGLFASPLTLAQPPRTRPSPNDNLESVEVAPDGKVTFRIYAPKANEVSVTGDFGIGGKLVKDDEGVWSIEVGPLKPDFYSYIFTVDEVRTVDPKNPRIKQGVSSLDSMFEVPGEQAAFEALQDVPHGEVRAAWYRSRTLNMQRRMQVYTPPGYDASDDKYPVLYLLHGGGDDDLGWSSIGRAGFILDNLNAQSKVVPMIVVMPNGSPPILASLRSLTPSGAPSPAFRAAMEAAQNQFVDELMKEVLPYTEKTYRVRPGPAHRAIAGLSMGGGQTLRVLTRHPDQFAYVSIWSAGLFGGSAAEWEERNGDFLAAPEKVNSTVKLLSIMVGDEDFALAGSQSLADLLKKHDIKTEFQITSGGHTWINWRRYLNDLAPRLFR